ncbi:hypothetical protein C7S18_14335 [Ahniella affigens]|uniref:Uncharacterized protein n=1 Tax=Ahniella affigens TaxID=2021234 RepID=A0A2P1PTY0_9GAMM|nr:hypothetical protein C7S18_14335 [Ahniella affigens]
MLVEFVHSRRQQALKQLGQRRINATQAQQLCRECLGLRFEQGFQPRIKECDIGQGRISASEHDRQLV